MSVLIKPGVTFVYAPSGFRILEALKLVSRNLKVDVTITSGSDGAHSSPADPHYFGGAYDLRTHDLPDKQKLLTELLAELGPAFTGFIENPGLAAEHIHVQRKYGTVYTIQDYLQEPEKESHV